MFKTLTSLATAMTVIVTFSATVSAAEKLTIGFHNAASPQMSAYVLKAIIEENFGVEVDVVSSTPAVIWKGLDTGDIDVYPEAWMPNQATMAAEYVDKNQSVLMSDHPYDAVQGICVTKMTQDKHGIKSVFDLANPEVSALFDSNGDGKGELWIGAPGWTSTNVERVKARDYGYGEFFELTTMDETLVLSQLNDAYRRERPYVFFCYKPHYMFQMYELALLEEPAYKESQWKMLQPSDDPDWLEKSHIDVAWPAIHLHVAWAKTLEERMPDVAKFLSNIQMDSQMVSTWVYALAVDKVDPLKYTKQWVSENAETVNKWLGQ